jgi:hypothetical protein
MLGPRMCPRCGARVDARVGRWSTVCLSCGHPLDPMAGAASARQSSSAVIWWVLGGAALFLLLAVVGGGLLVARAVLSDSRSSAPSEPVGTVTAVPTSTQPPIVASVASVAPSASASAKPNAPLSAAELDDLPGNYTCSLDDTPPFRCRIQNGILEKLDGSQRFKGPVTKQGDGNLAFSGTFFCPFGDCTHPVATTFIRQGPGRYVGKFGPNSVPGGGPGGERVVLNKVR